MKFTGSGKVTNGVITYTVSGSILSGTGEFANATGTFSTDRNLARRPLRSLFDERFDHGEDQVVKRPGGPSSFRTRGTRDWMAPVVIMFSEPGVGTPTLTLGKPGFGRNKVSLPDTFSPCYRLNGEPACKAILDWAMSFERFGGGGTEEVRESNPAPTGRGCGVCQHLRQPDRKP